MILLSFAGAEHRNVLHVSADPCFEGKRKCHCPVKTFLPFVAALMIAATAQAQLLPTWETHITLTQQDLDMIHGKPVGTTASWTNPASGNSGSIRLVKTPPGKTSNAGK